MAGRRPARAAMHAGVVKLAAAPVLGVIVRPVPSARRERVPARSPSSRRLEFETVVAEMLLQLLDPPPDESSAFERAGNVDRLAIAAERKGCLAFVRADVAENPLD